MSIKRITSKKPYLLTEDDDCHWYLIPYDEHESFYRWVNNCENGEEDLDYSEFRINGPHTLKIYSWADDSSS